MAYPLSELFRCSMQSAHGYAQLSKEPTFPQGLRDYFYSMMLDMCGEARQALHRAAQAVQS